MRILFVCYGNICRSPMAEAFMRRAVGHRPALRGVDVGSRGVGALADHAATEHAIDVLRDDHALDLTSHRARQLQPSVEADLILTLDRLTTTMVERLTLSEEVVMLGDYAGGGEEVKDPYGREREAYRACAEHVAALVELVADRLAAEAAVETPKPTGLVCPQCRQPVATAVNRLPRTLVFWCRACDNRWSVDEPGTPKP